MQHALHNQLLYAIMKRLIISILVLASPISVFATEYKCNEHGYYLTLKTGGFEHVNHNLLLSGKVLIKELEEAMWFIEEVKCISEGFEVVASHIQYNDPTKKKFIIKVINNEKYEIK